MNYKEIIKVFNTCVEENITCEDNNGIEVLDYLRKGGSKNGKETICER